MSLMMIKSIFSFMIKNSCAICLATMVTILGSLLLTSILWLLISLMAPSMALSFLEYLHPTPQGVEVYPTWSWFAIIATGVTISMLGLLTYYAFGWLFNSVPAIPADVGTSVSVPPSLDWIRELESVRVPIEELPGPSMSDTLFNVPSLPYITVPINPASNIVNPVPMPIPQVPINIPHPVEQASAVSQYLNSTLEVASHTLEYVSALWPF